MSELDTMGARLRWARERSGYADAAQFARTVRINPTTYRAYENDQNSYSRRAPELAEKLGVPTDWLLRGGPEPHVPRSAEPSITSEVQPSGIADPRAEKYGTDPLPPIPVVGSAIGIRSFDPNQHVELTELDMAEVLDHVSRPRSLAGDPNAYSVTTVGDSMWPRFRPGRRLIVSPRAPVAIGDDVIVQLRSVGSGDGDFRDRITMVLIKELVRRTATYIELRQFNPDVTFQVPVEQVAAVHRVSGEIF